jgi:hypothetical protein
VGLPPAFHQRADIGATVPHQVNNASVREKGLEKGQTEAILRRFFQEADWAVAPCPEKGVPHGDEAADYL